MTGPVGQERSAFAHTWGEQLVMPRPRKLHPRRTVTGKEGSDGERPTGAKGALTPYLTFIREGQARLKRSGEAPEEKERELRVLLEFQEWALRQEEAELRRQEPEAVYRELKAARVRQEHEEARRGQAVEAKLEEYFRWAEARWGESAQRVRLTAPRHLLTEHPLRAQSLDALTAAVLDWALTHTRDEDFLRKSPGEVALYLLARRSALATAVELGRQAPPSLDYTPPEDTRPPPEELVVELLAGLLPVVGEATDAFAFVSGYSFTGHKLGDNERLLSGMAVLVPFVPGRALSGAEEVGRIALVTGRSLDEVRVLQRVALHLRPEDASHVEGLVRAAGRGEVLGEEDVALLRRVAAGLEKPLSEAVATLRQGGRVPLVGSRLSEAGLRLEPGSAEHLAAAWVDYQFRHPGKYPHFNYAIDGEWKKRYETILKTRRRAAGSRPRCSRHGARRRTGR